MQIQRELKFRISPRAAGRVWRLVRLVKAPRRQAIVSVYYDTKGERLRRAGASLRLRREDRRWEQSLQAESAAYTGLTERSVWARAAPRGRLDAGAFPREAIMAATGLDLQRLAPKLRPLFETRFFRRSCALLLDRGGRAELSIDRGWVSAGRQREPLLEMEFILLSEEPCSMLRLAEKLARQLGLEIEFESKAQHGYRLASGEPAQVPHKWSRPALAERTSPGEAFAALFAAALRQAGANARGVLTSRDPEFLHQMRVGFRRLRSALRAYRRIVSRGDAKPLARELRRIVSPLGAARDWDVFCEWLAGEAKNGTDDSADVRQLLAAARRRRTAARRGARGAVSSWRFQRFLLRALRWLFEAPWERHAAARQAALAEFGRRSLERLHRKTVKHAHAVDWRNVARRHVLRVKVKRLRYAGEFFSASFPRAAVRSYLKRLQSLQDILGELNDVAVARRFLAELAPHRAAPMHPAAARVRRALGARERALIASLEPAWASFLKRRPFWRAAPEAARARG